MSDRTLDALSRDRSTRHARRRLLRPHPPRVPLGGRRRLHRRWRWPACSSRDGFFAAAPRPPTASTPSSPTRSPRSRRTSPPKAKSVIFLFMYGGPSHVDTFDYKPKLYDARRQDDRRQDVRPRRQEERGARRRAEVEVQAVRPVRQVGQRPLPAPGHLRRRHRVPPLDDRRLADPRLGHAPDEHGQDPLGQPVPGLVGQLRPRQREREPARLRRHARPDRRADQRREELVERLHAGQLPGHHPPLGRRRRSSTSNAPDGHERRPCSAGCSTRCSEYNAEHLAARADNSEPRRPRSPATRWPSRCSGTPPEAVDLRQETEETQGALRHRRPADRATSAAAACWPAGWSSAACGSSSSTPAAPTTTATGTPTATS